MWLLGDVLLPFVAGMAIAYLCNPLTNRLERMHVPRWLGALIVIALVVLFFVLLILLIVPVIAAQLSAFIHDLPGYIAQAAGADQRSEPPLAEPPGRRTFAGADKSAERADGPGRGARHGFPRQVWSGGAAVISLFSLLVITPVVAFYFIVDWPRIIDSLERLVPRSQHDTVVKLARQTDAAIAGFVRGQTLVCVVLGVALCGRAVGGRAEFRPADRLAFRPDQLHSLMSAPLTGFVLATVIAVAQFWPDWIWIVVVVAIFLIGQFIEGNILVPKLVGESIGLHPLWLMFALFAFGYLFGFLGLLLAVPHGGGGRRAGAFRRRPLSGIARSIRTGRADAGSRRQPERTAAATCAGARA